MKHKTRAGIPLYWLLSFALIGALFLTSACGKKAPPLPPTDFELPAVEALTSDLDGEKLTLKWPVPDWEAPVGIELAGFNVYRAKVPEGEVCDECPVRYQKVDAIEIDDLTAVFGSDLEYRESLEKGFQYRYKVIPYTNTGREGDESPIVRINY